MPHLSTRRTSGQVQVYRQRLRHAADLPIAKLLSAEDVDAAVAAEGYSFRERLFTPLITVWVFLSQVSSADPSCLQAVLRFVGWLAAHRLPVCSSNTGAYCQARQRLPEGILSRLTRWTGSQLEAQSPAAWKWHGLRVLIGDGSTLSMPDTSANQKTYPQSRTQKQGVGFPIMRILVLFALSTGTVLDAACNPYHGKETGETAMLRTLLYSLKRGDLLVADRYFANYWIIAIAQSLGIHVVFRQHQLRRVDFRCGVRLGKDDHLVTWTKPARPSWMTKAFYATVPATLTLRELRLRIPKSKKITKEIVIVTTLADAGRYAKGELQALYRQRWQAELHLRSLKTTMQMDILRCKTPEMVRKEMWAHFLVYNLIRKAMAQAAAAQDRAPWQISFKGALQALDAWGGFWPVGRPEDPDAYYNAMLDAIVQHRVGHRPDRSEPRAVKRRPKPYPKLKEPRAEARAKLDKSGGR